jgi:hypothetical protein
MEKNMKYFLLSLAFVSQLHANEIVDFHIIKGTENKNWNTPETIVKVQVGQVLRIYNDDEIVHRLHTSGAPCNHGPSIAPQAYWDCTISKTYSDKVNGELYEHNVGPSARFYLEATN